jgi:hypothetical protein
MGFAVSKNADSRVIEMATAAKMLSPHYVIPKSKHDHED